MKILDAPFIPAIQKGEPVTNYLLRLLPYLNSENQRNIIQTQIAHYRARPSWILPRGLDQLAELLGKEGGGVALMRRQTLAPLYYAFLDHKDGQKLVDYTLMEEGEAKFNVTKLVSHNRVAWSLALCPQCVRESQPVAGTHIVKRIHLLPSLAICHRHGEPLIEGCGACAWGRRHTRAPFFNAKQCACGKKLRPRYERLTATDIEHDARLGSIARRLLDCDTDGSVARDLAVQMQRSAHARGLLTRKGIAHSLREFLSDTVGTRFLERHGIHLPDKSIFYGRLRRGEAIGNPMVGTVLALALLGDKFNLGPGNSAPIREKNLSEPPTPPKRVRREYLSHAESTGTVKLGKRQLSSTEFTQHCRALLLKHTRKHPGTPRKWIMGKMSPAVRKWLRARDSEFLNQTLPSVGRSRATIEAHLLARGEDYDRSLAAHMRRQHAALWAAQADKPFRVTARLLTANHPSATVIKWKSDPIPESIKTLQELQETVPAFARRVLCHLWVSSGHYPDFQAAAKRAKLLSDDEVKAERAKARRQARKKWNFEN